MKAYFVLGITLSLFAAAAFAESRIELEETKVQGASELPKVLYIVPWKQAEIPDLSQPPLESLIDEALTPVDREVFQRQVRYYDAIGTQEVRNNENQ